MKTIQELSSEILSVQSKIEASSKASEVIELETQQYKLIRQLPVFQSHTWPNLPGMSFDQRAGNFYISDKFIVPCNKDSEICGRNHGWLSKVNSHEQVRLGDFNAYLASSPLVQKYQKAFERTTGFDLGVDFDVDGSSLIKPSATPRSPALNP